MNTRPATIAAVLAIVVVGFAIGGWLAFVTRPSGDVTRITTTAKTIHTPDVVRSAVPIAAATEASTPRPAVTLLATSNPAVTTGRSVPAGSWDLQESNAQVGTIVWAADLASASGDVVLNAHKQSVGGRPAVPCERQTSLHAEFPAGTGPHSVPYREVNCEGVVTTGEMRVSGIPGSGSSFSGSFWRDGVKLGDFTARRQ